jgi:hypothetical protein
MGFRVPKNQIIKSKYTSGKEYMFVSTYREYQGYYYESSGKLYAGEVYDSAAPELMRINSNNVNRLLTNPFTYVYGKVAKNNTITFTSPTLVPSVVFNPNNQTTQFTNRYFTNKVNVSPTIIKEISKDTYDKIVTDPIYNTVIIKWNNEGNNDIAIAEAEKKMPGITAFLKEETGDSFEG